MGYYFLIPAKLISLRVKSFVSSVEINGRKIVEEGAPYLGG